MSPTKLAERPGPDGPRRGRGRGRGAWSPRTTLAYCWRSRAAAGLGAWLLVSPWLLGSGQDTTSAQNAIVAGATLIGAALWALLSRRPAQAHAVTVAVGVWLLLAPTLWYFGGRRRDLELDRHRAGRDRAVGLGAGDRAVDPASAGTSRQGTAASVSGGLRPGGCRSAAESSRKRRR